MSKISYSVMKKLKMERLIKRQSNFDNVIVFDEEFETKYNHYGNKHLWLTFVDFSTTYKYDPNNSCLKIATYKDIVDKANEWLRQLPQYKRTERLIPGQPIWTITNCETLYAKISINFAESGEITRKRVMQFSKWPLNDELFMNLYCDSNTMSQNFEQIFNGRYIVVLLRVWMAKQPYYHMMYIGQPPTISVKDYWPQKITIEEIAQEKKSKKSIEIRRKLRKTLSIDSSSHSAHHHSEQKECLEKIQEVTKRINDDIIQRKINGAILNVVTFPCYMNKENIQSESKIEMGKIPVGHIVNLMRVFYIENINCEYENTNDNNKRDLIGFVDFVPKCISGGGFIKYPRFETQNDIIDKATLWMTKNRQYRFINFSSVDIKLRSMTSIDSGEMTFSRNTGDFVRILRLCYLRPNVPIEDNINKNDTLKAENDEGTISSRSIADITNWTPAPMPPQPIYLQCKYIISINNSIKELQQQMNDYLIKVKKNELIQQQQNAQNGYPPQSNWKFLCADSVAIFISNERSSSSHGGGGSADSRHRRNNLLADCDKSFHAISISSTNMNRNMLNGINIFYDIGLYGQRSKFIASNNPQSNDFDQNASMEEDNCSSNSKSRRSRRNRPDSSTTTTTRSDQSNNCHIS